MEKVGSCKLDFHGPGARICDRTFGEWTAEWWRWIMSTPASVSPLLDETGQHAGMNQPTSCVWFLTGSFACSEKNYPFRKVKIPRGRSILFPIINCEASRMEYPLLKTDSALVEHVMNDMNSIIKKECFINGLRVNPERVPSEPQLFSIDIGNENVIGIRNGGMTYATADGFWVFMKPANSGRYVITFEGSCELDRLNSGASYDLEIS